MACRWQTMGGTIPGWKSSQGRDMSFSLLGEHDYGWEMKLVLMEEIQRLRDPSHPQEKTGDPFVYPLSTGSHLG